MKTNEEEKQIKKDQETDKTIEDDNSSKVKDNTTKTKLSPEQSEQTKHLLGNKHGRNGLGNLNNFNPIIENTSYISSKYVNDKYEKKIKELILIFQEYYNELFDAVCDDSYSPENVSFKSHNKLNTFISKEINRPLEFEVEEKLTVEQYYYFLINAAHTINDQQLFDYFKKHTEKIGNFVLSFQKIVLTNFHMFFDDSIDSLLKKDLFLTIIRNYQYSRKSFCTLIMSKLIMNKVYNSSIVDGLSIIDLKQYIQSKASMEAYRKVFVNQQLDQFLKYNSKNKNNIIDQTIKDILLPFLDNVNIYRANLGIKLAAVTIFNLNIIINNSIFNFDNEVVRKAYLITTLLHELCHCLMRLFKRDKNKTNNFYDTLEKDECNESGNYYESLLFNNQEYAEIDSLYLLDLKNWSHSAQTFLKNYQKEIIKREEAKKNDTEHKNEKEYKVYKAKATHNKKKIMTCSRSLDESD